MKTLFQSLATNYKPILQSRQRGIVISIVASMATVIFLRQSGSTESMENRFGRPALFHLREALQLAPSLDPRLIIYSYNDEAVSEWGRPETLSGTQWNEILTAISDHNPQAILIDMMFARRRKDPADVAAMNRAFKQKSPIYTAAAVLPSTLQRFKPFAMNSANFQASRENLDFLKKFSTTNATQTVLGPADNLNQLHETVGHINFRSPGFFMPIVPFPPDRMLKQLALAQLPAHSLKINQLELYVNGQQLWLNQLGEALINWGPRREYAKNTFKIIDLVEMRRSGKYSSLIKPDSIVLFLPLAFTGNNDFKETFIGELLGGYAQAAIINSTLNGKWLRLVDLGYAGVVSAIFLGLIGGMIRKNYLMILFATLSNLFFCGIVTGFFVYQSWLIDWLGPTIAFNMALLPVILSTTIAGELRSIRIHNALVGVLSPKMLSQISKSPDTFSLAPVEQTVTVMFVDFAGFSTLAERMHSRIVFESLKKHFTELGRIIHAHNGLVDKSLGDGLLGVFGFDPVTRAISTTHAEDAATCAQEIQKLIANGCADYNKSPTEDASVIFAARIGLNTGSVYIGNVGEEGRLDLTVIGHTVNLGKRFEDACEIFKVLLGEDTRKHLPAAIRDQLSRRNIQIKHHKELIEAWELDPFTNNEQLYRDALTGFRNFSNISRGMVRIPTPEGQKWVIYLHGQDAGRAVDYSSGGLCISLNAYYGNKVKLVFDLVVESTVNGKLIHELRGLVTTVKWGAKTDTGFRHGISFTEESAERFKVIFDSVQNKL